MDILNHNIETVPRLYPTVRPEADFERSLALLEYARRQRPDLPTKSGLMVGLGETAAEVEDVLVALRRVSCSMLTIGQYLQPTRSQPPVARYVRPGEFQQWSDAARALGFGHVLSGPLVRSSYHAADCRNAIRTAAFRTLNS
jgi:lipoic acid synthetase